MTSIVGETRTEIVNTVEARAVYWNGQHIGTGLIAWSKTTTWTTEDGDGNEQGSTEHHSLFEIFAPKGVGSIPNALREQGYRVHERGWFGYDKSLAEIVKI